MTMYLASPYSHPDPAVRQARYRAACQATAELMRHGLNVLSPIIHSHPLAELGLPTNWDFWQQIDQGHCLLRCDELLVLMLDGWRESRGVTAEIELAHAHEIRVSYVLLERVSEFATKRVTLARGRKEMPLAKCHQARRKRPTVPNVRRVGSRSHY